jgi:membrane-anchored protein YejM (alkaline phosphatase superfamily)
MENAKLEAKITVTPLLLDLTVPIVHVQVDKLLSDINRDAELRNEMMKVEAERGMRFLEKEDRLAYGKPTRAERRANRHNN